MSSLQPVRGTHDLMFDDIRRHRFVESLAFGLAQRYGYAEIATPIFEFTEVFSRTLGETSDIVTKEMYTFQSAGGESLTLRPEGTAGVARAFISNGLAQQTPLKFFYRGPMFRHERPQKGRQRQFHQIGVELIGVATPQADIEVIALADHILKDLALAGAVALEINSLGDAESRAAYRAVLVKFFEGRIDKLSAESRERLSRNPLRVLDSKDPADKAVVADAPRYTDHLNQSSRDFFQAVQDGLSALGIAFVVNPALVRGLDYYSHTAFEFTTQALGAQGTVLAGGRYDGLIADMGGPQTPGIGWAAGVERLAMLLSATPAEPRPFAVVPVGETETAAAIRLCHELRRQGFRVDMGYGGNMGKRMKRANKVNAVAAIILGEDELRAKSVTVRMLDTGAQSTVALVDLAAHLSAISA
ncbi:MAG: histidine--tRNA ligase [Rhodospirillaceae bacterium]|nr:histidine--tRNA ligase [Rhodospirillaceae bacterium]